ncbi:crotonyl-CoA carboxylase/reductase [Actinospica sp. MGRD01-02]|uniref:Crotonyl-CoA carboxylase/reductase n=1 Tax=Actinospica acidithermotolerans TaxID=2828514 RepID=A0A941IK47_9ACTN|nr:crotonyl-CoA carboxylase/reductase [Actinospica acidithermotolerans]MBR7830159.1 crotonyl-CoA carboxylase/reductase [Actinospica acidithermotolerans]
MNTNTPLTEAVLAGADGEELAATPLPETFRAAYLRREDQEIFRGVQDKDVRRTLHIGEVPMPELAPDEVVVAVMAAAVNYNTVWSATFEPLPSFQFLKHVARAGGWDARHDQDFHVIGSDASGVVVRVGAAVRHWKAGDKVVVTPGAIDEQEPAAQQDGLLADRTLAWGFETNYGAFGDYAIVKATQLMRKPRHLSWEEAACNSLCLGTAYRMLISKHGARMKMGDVVLIWGATGGLGGYAVQLVQRAGGIPVGVVGNARKAALLEKMGCRHVINRQEIGFTDCADGTDETGEMERWRSLGAAIRKQVGEDPHVVFEHVGKETFGASVFVARRGGSVVTCGSSTGYAHNYDNRHLWMRVKRIIGSHGANYQEAVEANRLLELGILVPTLSRVYPFAAVGEATRSVQRNEHEGKVGVLCLASEEGLGVEDPLLRGQIGEERLRLFRDHEV